MFKIELTYTAFKFYKSADKILKKKIDKALFSMSNNPYESNNIKALRGEYSGLYRYRIGDFRIIYSIESEKDKIIVVAISHRKEIY